MVENYHSFLSFEVEKIDSLAIPHEYKEEKNEHESKY